MSTPDRQQFADVTAAAYVDQFSINGSPVMNNMIIVYDGNSFGRQSSLTPVQDNEVEVMSLEDGIFGDVDADDPEAATWIAGYLTDSSSDELWETVTTAIEQQ